MLRILIIEDHTLFRELLTPIIEKLEEEVIVYEASNLKEAINLIKYYKHIDLIILDLSYPGDHSWNNFPFTNGHIKMTPIIILTGSTSMEDLNVAISKGCKGYITKSSSKQQLLMGIKTVLDGKTFISPDMLALIGNSNGRVKDTDNKPKQIDNLSNRQLQILGLLSKGYSNKNIATHCQISEGTVKLHVSTILKILGVSNRTQAVIKVSKLNL